MANDWKTSIRNMRLRIEQESQLKLAKEFTQKLIGVNPIDIPIGEFISDKALEKAKGEKLEMDKKEMFDKIRSLLNAGVVTTVEEAVHYLEAKEQAENKQLILANKFRKFLDLDSSVDISEAMDFISEEALEKAIKDKRTEKEKQLDKVYEASVQLGSQTKETSNEIFNSMKELDTHIRDRHTIINPLLDEFKETVWEQQMKVLSAGKYEHPIHKDNHTSLEWLDHQMSEMADALVYHQCLKQTINDVIDILRNTKKLHDSMKIKRHIADALEILGGDK